MKKIQCNLTMIEKSIDNYLTLIFIEPVLDFLHYCYAVFESGYYANIYFESLSQFQNLYHYKVYYSPYVGGGDPHYSYIYLSEL